MSLATVHLFNKPPFIQMETSSVKFFVKLHSAILVDGVIRPAGTVLEVDEDLATNLLYRGKAELVSEDEAQA